MTQMLTAENIDWNRLWKEDRKTSIRVRDPEYWNRRAPSFTQHVREDDYDDYIDPFLRLLDAQQDWSVLDVGSGPGTLACPLAKNVRQVTAIDFSPAMLELLDARKEAAGLHNITTRIARWEDDWKALGIEPHDAAISSRSLGSDDPRALLTKLMSFAKRRVVVSCAVGNGPFNQNILEAVGREVPSAPDYIYIYNLLHQMGIYANVSMIEKSPRTFADEEDAVDGLRWMLDQITPTEEKDLRRFVSAHLVADGQRWKLDCQRPVCWAAIWWNINPQP
jgi:SAM-dependent methyltransferase